MKVVVGASPFSSDKIGILDGMSISNIMFSLNLSEDSFISLPISESTDISLRFSKKSPAFKEALVASWSKSPKMLATARVSIC